MNRPDLLAGEELPPPPRQRRSREKRARLHQAGLRLFAQRGYEGAAVEDIARRAGLAVGGFYLHYRSKRQLLLSLTDELLRSLERVNLDLGGGPDVRSALRTLLSRALTQDLRYLGAYRAWQEAVLSDANLAARHRRIHAWTTERVLHALRRLARVPGARRGVDLPGLARVLDSLFWSFLGRALSLGRAEADRWIEATTHLVYHALFPDSAEKGRDSC